MSNNLSSRYEKSGFSAIVIPDKNLVINVFPVVANQIYNVMGITVIFAETKEELKTICTEAGYSIKAGLFS